MSTPHKIVKIGVPLQEWENTDVPCRVSPQTFDSNQPAQIKLAKKICSQCPYQQNCLELAQMWVESTGQEPDGIWGGTTRMERLLNKISGTKEDYVLCAPVGAAA